MPETGKEKIMDSFRLRVKSYVDQIEPTIRRLEQQEMTPETTLKLDNLAQDYSKFTLLHREGINDEEYIEQLQGILDRLDSLY